MAMTESRAAATAGVPIEVRVHAAWVASDRRTRVAHLTAVVLSLLLPAVWWGARSFVRAVVDVTPVVVVGSGVAGAILATAALVDLHERRLPSVLLTWAMGSAAVGVGCHASIAADPELLLLMVVGAVVCGGVLLGVYLTRGIGMGDVKMAAVVGAATAPLALVAAPLALAVGAGVAGVWGRVTHRHVIALGPFLWIGWFVASCAAAVGLLR